jgi:hypothetical protein
LARVRTSVTSAQRDAKRRARSDIGSACPGVGNGMKYMHGAGSSLTLGDRGMMQVGEGRDEMTMVMRGIEFSHTVHGGRHMGVIYRRRLETQRWCSLQRQTKTMFGI